MNTNLTIGQLRIEFSKEMSKVPSFVAKSPLNGVLWQAIKESNTILIRLVKDKVLTDNAVARVINEFNEYMEAIVEYTTPDIHLSVSAYYVLLIESMIIRSKQEEHYEVCSNLKKFHDYYFTNTEEDGND